MFLVSMLRVLECRLVVDQRINHRSIKGTDNRIIEKERP